MTMRLPEHLRLRLLGRLQLRLLKRLQMRLQLRLQLHFRQPTSFPIALHRWRAKSLPVHVLPCGCACCCMGSVRVTGSDACS